MNLLKNGIYILLLLTLSFACSSDDDDTTTADTTAPVITLTGDATVTITVGDTYTDAGASATDDTDGDITVVVGDDTLDTSTAGTYTITYNVSDAAGNAATEVTRTVIVEAETTGSTAIAGSWKIAPQAGSLGVGPAQGDISWWSLSEADVTTRACFLDDEYVFGEDGSFSNVVGADTWLEAWQGVAEDGCGAPVYPHDGSASATYTYDETAGTVTIDGSGAYLGLTKVYNDGELTSPSEAGDIESITYTVVEISGDGNTMTLEINFGPGYWTYILQRSESIVESSAIAGSWSIAAEAGSLGVGPAQGDISWWSLSEADVTTRACLLDDEYVFGEDGSFSNVMGADTWLEAWQGVAEGCGAPVYPHDGSASATYTYDETAGTVTIDGSGAYLGLTKVYNDGELASPSEAGDIESITYTVVEISGDGNTMTLEINFGPGYWTYVLTKNN